MPQDILQGSFLDSDGDLFGSTSSSRPLSTPARGSVPPTRPYETPTHPYEIPLRPYDTPTRTYSDTPYQQADPLLEQRFRQFLAAEALHMHPEQSASSRSSRSQSVFSDSTQASIEARIRQLEDIIAEQGRSILSLRNTCTGTASCVQRIEESLERVHSTLNSTAATTQAANTSSGSLLQPPVTPQADVPQEDCWRFYHESQWTNKNNGDGTTAEELFNEDDMDEDITDRMKSKKSWGYVENKAGQTVSERRIARIRAFASHYILEVERQHGAENMPSTWDRCAPLSWREEFIARIEQAFPELTFCSGHWKARSIIIAMYAQYNKNKKKQMRRLGLDTKTEAKSEEPSTVFLGKRRAEEPPAEVRAPKRTRPAEPALVFVDALSDVFEDCPIKLPPITPVVATAASSAAGPSAGPSAAGPSAADDSAADDPAAGDPAAGNSAASDSALHSALDSATDLTAVDSAAATSSVAGISTANSTTVAPTSAGTAAANGSLDAAPHAGDSTTGKTGTSKIKGGTKAFEAGPAITLRNIAGRAWLKDHKSGTIAEFKQYMDNMSKEDKKKFNEEVKAAKKAQEK